MNDVEGMPRERKTRRSFLRASGVGIAAFSLAGCLDDGNRDDTGPPGDAGSEGIERGGNFTIGYPDGVENPNPLTASSAYTWGVLDLIYQPGVFVDPRGFEVLPWAFTEWEYEELDEGMNVYFSINDELRWTDGEAFTVDDALFTYEYYMEQEPTRYLAAIDPMESVSEADNGFDVRIELNEVVGAWDVEQLGLYLLPRHVWEGVEDHRTHEVDEPVGLGPGRITRFEPDTAVEVELDGETPFTRYDWMEGHELFIDGGPFLESVRFQIFGSDAALQREFLNGIIDAIYDDAFNLDQAETAENRDGLSLIDGQDDGFRHFTVNMRVTPFDDQAFRQALRMAMDEIGWVRRVELGYGIPGSVVVPPAYEHIRPETAAGEGIQQSPDEEAHPAIRALWFREAEEGVLDVDAVREFLESGDVITGAGGTYAGFEYPGSLTDFGETFQTEAAYEYEFGEVRSDVLREAGVDRELYVGGQTIEERNGGPLTMLNFPPDARPRIVDFTRDYVEDIRRLGIPIEQEILTFRSMSERVYTEADFDIHPMAWSNFSTRGTTSLYSFFHSDNAHAEDSESDTFASNASGYGLEGLPGADEEIDAMRHELDEERRNALVRRVAERMYLEAPTFVMGYSLLQWPVNAGDYAGFISDIPGPGSSNLWKQCLNVHRR